MNAIQGRSERDSLKCMCGFHVFVTGTGHSRREFKIRRRTIWPNLARTLHMLGHGIANATFTMCMAIVRSMVNVQIEGNSTQTMDGYHYLVYKFLLCLLLMRTASADPRLGGSVLFLPRAGH